MCRSVQGWISSRTKQTEAGGQCYIPFPHLPPPTPKRSCFPEEAAEQDTRPGYLVL